MSRYHINPSTQKPSKCQANPGNCPFKTSEGGETPHYASIEEARASIEKENEKKYSATTSISKTYSCGVTQQYKYASFNKKQGVEHYDTKTEAMKAYEKKIANSHQKIHKLSKSSNSKPKKDYSQFEEHVSNVMEIGSTFTYQGKTYTVKNSDKPKCLRGEPKTDVYFSLVDNETQEVKEYKLSLKQDNADFIENKITSQRAQGIFGDNYEQRTQVIINDLIKNLEHHHIPTVNKIKKTLTVGYRLDILRSGNRKLAVPIDLTHDEKIEIYSGENLPESKKDSLVNGVVIKNSGVANYILEGVVTRYSTPQDILDSITPLEEYVDSEDFPQHYAILAAVNLRNSAGSIKIESSRPLAVTVEYDNLGKHSYISQPSLKVTSTHMKTHYDAHTLKLIDL